MVLSKAMESALAALTHLAETYDGGKTSLTVDEIALQRDLPRPFVAKLLTTLARHRLVISKRGRKGGFYLARPPARITLHDVAKAMTFEVGVLCCVFGPQWGEKNPCPLHDEVQGMRQGVCDFLLDNTLAGFAKENG